MVERWLLSTAFDVLEAENDAQGLKTLRRIMVPYFLAGNPGKLTSKYAASTMLGNNNYNSLRHQCIPTFFCRRCS